MIEAEITKHSKNKSKSKSLSLKISLKISQFFLYLCFISGDVRKYKVKFA